MEKHLFYHNLKLEKEPWKFSTGSIKFAGIKKMCNLCRANIHNHFKHHKVPHLNCKLCVYQMKTMTDKTFWDKVCNLCGKICSSEKSLKYWHKRTHSSDWMCQDCDMDFTRKWTLKRHLIEIHGMEPEDFDFQSHDENDASDFESDDINDDSDSSDIVSESESDENSLTSDVVSDGDRDEGDVKIKCNYCEKLFSVQRYLDVHIKNKHSARKAFNCDECNHSFTLKNNLKRHEEMEHGKKRSDFLEPNVVLKTNTCDFCGMNFSRMDNLNEHIKRAHLNENDKFTCKYCGRNFDRKFSMNRHEKTCKSNNDLFNK